MSWTLHVRGDSLDARRGVEGATANALGSTPAVVNTTVPGINGSTSIDFSGSLIRPIIYKGGNNVTSTGDLSVVMRIYVTAFGSNRPLFFIGTGGRLALSGWAGYITSANQLRVYSTDETGTTYAQFSSSSILTLNTWHDLVFTFSGSLEANANKIYVDGVQDSQITSTVSMDNLVNFKNNLIPHLAYYPNGIDESSFYCDEFALNDTLIDPTASGLNLNGASRSSYLSTTAMDGPSAVVLPTESQVLTGIGFTDGTTSYTGNITLPAIEDVEENIQYGASGTQYTGTLVVNAPATSLTNATSISASIKAKTLAFLGSPWSELGYSRDVEKNSNKSMTKRYGVNPKGANEAPELTRNITAEHEFEVVLTDNYINTTMSDSNEQTVVQDLQDKSFSLYRYFIETRLNNLNVINITDFTMQESETNEDSKQVTQRFTFNVRYRTNF